MELAVAGISTGNLCTDAGCTGGIGAAAGGAVVAVADARGGRVTPLKLRIFELVRRAGPGGIGGDDLFAIVYDGQLPRYRGGHDGRGGTRQRNTLKSNIYQINRQLVDYRIVCSGRDRAARYYLR